MIILLLTIYNGPDPFFVLFGFLLLFLVARIFWKTKDWAPQKNAKEEDKLIPPESDVLGLTKQQTTNNESFTKRKKPLNWNFITLVVLIILGLYLILAQTDKKHGPLHPIPTQTEINEAK